MHASRFATSLLFLIAGLFVAVAAPAATITGAGSSAAKLVYQSWGERFAQNTHIQLDYAAVGSSAGIRKIVAREVDFGASDVAPDAATLEKNDLVLVPTVVTGAVPVVNLPGRSGRPIQLDGATLARIFMRQVQRWNDPAIVALNPGIQLPDLPIRVVVRSDGSGTTYNFTDYLAKVSEPWKSAYGVDKRIDWPAGVDAVDGSGGVVAAVKSTEGAIGYVDYTYVLKHALSGVRMKNAAGRFVTAGLDSFRAALSASVWQSRGDFSVTLTDQAGADSWPITMGTFVLLPRRMRNTEEAVAMVRFFTWSFMHGDELAATAHFVRLPDAVQAKAYRALAQVTDEQGASLAFRALAQ